MKVGKRVLIASVCAVLCLPPASQATSVRGQAFGLWTMACPRGMGVREQNAHCMIEFRSPRPEVNPSVMHITWTVWLGPDGQSYVASSGRSRTTCYPMVVTQELRRNYRLTDATIQLWRMEELADSAYQIMRSHIAYFGNCPNEGADSEPYAETLLEAREDDFTRALIAAETRLRGRGPDSNGGTTTPSNLGGLEIRASEASLERLAAVAAELDWYIDSRTTRRLVLMPPPNYRPVMLDTLLERGDALGLSDLDIRLIGPYGRPRLQR